MSSLLIHSGLPWSNPQKIIISSAEYINNAIINRGLINLLNNDYYLDIKAEAINNYIEQHIKQHIADQNIHVPWQQIQKLSKTNYIATKDSVYLIPITYNGKKLQVFEINQLIKSIPRNLNGFTTVILFCNAHSKEEKQSYDSEYNCGSFNINISNFINGQLIITSDSQGDYVLDKLSYTSIEQKKESAIKHIQIIENELYNYLSTNFNKRITFKGSGYNNNISTISIMNCQATVYFYNCTVQNYYTGLDVSKEYMLPKIEDLMNIYFQNEESDYTIEYSNLNSNFLFQNISYYLYANHKLVYTENNSNSNSNQPPVYVKMNTQDTLSGKNSPQYFSFDKIGTDNTAKTVSQQLRKYIYYSQSDFTIAFFGKLLTTENNMYKNTPIFSDYINSQKYNYGLNIYLNKICRQLPGKTDPLNYTGNFQSCADNIVNQWGFYVLQFIHHSNNSSSPSYNFNDSENSIYVVSSAYSSPTSGHMLVNLYFCSLDNNKNEIAQNILFPSQQTMDSINNNSNNSDFDISDYCKKVGYQIPIFSEDQFGNPDQQFSIKMFANLNQITLNGSQSVLDNWDYFTGHIGNIFLFNSRLKKTEIRGMLKCIDKNITSYNWSFQSDDNLVTNILPSSYLGALYSYNNNNLNIINSKIIAAGNEQQ